MALQRADILHATGVFNAANGEAYNVAGLHNWQRVDVGVYTVECDESISGRESNVQVWPGINEPLFCGGRVEPDGLVTIRCYDSFQNPADAITLQVDVLHTQTGPTGELPEPAIPTPIPPPSGAVDSVFGRTGVVVAVAGDYEASLVTNDSGVAGATVADALDTLAALAAPVTSVFGRIGAVVATLGDYTSDLVNNASGVVGATVSDALDTLDAMIGAVALTVSTLSARILATVPYVEGFVTTRYEGTIDPFSGQTAGTVCVMMSPIQNFGGFQQLCGNNNGGGGGLSIALFGNTLLIQAWDSGGAQQTQFVNVPAIRLWNIVAMTIDTSGADMLMEIWWNGSRVFDMAVGGAGGALPAGGVFTIGAAPGGALQAEQTRVQGAGYVARVVTGAELADQFADALALGMFTDVSGGFDGAYRVTAGVNPGNPWVPFVGADNLTRTGPAVTLAADALPIYRTG